MLPMIAGVNTQNLKVKPYPSFTYKINRKNTVGTVDGMAAIKQAVFHCLNTERYAYIIYADNYGVGLEKYLGKSFAYLKANIGRDIREALLQDDRITDVTINRVAQVGVDKAEIEFTVTSNEGTFGVVGKKEGGEWNFDL